MLEISLSCLFRRALELEPELRNASDSLKEAETLLSNAACICTLHGHSDPVHDIIIFRVS